MAVSAFDLVGENRQIELQAGRLSVADKKARSLVVAR